MSNLEVNIGKVFDLKHEIKLVKFFVSDYECFFDIVAKFDKQKIKSLIKSVKQLLADEDNECVKTVYFIRSNSQLSFFEETKKSKSASCIYRIYIVQYGSRLHDKFCANNDIDEFNNYINEKIDIMSKLVDDLYADDEELKNIDKNNDEIIKRFYKCQEKATQ